MKVDELTKTLPDARKVGQQAAKALEQISLSAKVLQGADEDTLATIGGTEEGRIREAARQLHDQAGTLADFAARVLAQGGPDTQGWQQSLERVMVSLRQERGRLMIVGRSLSKEEKARMAAFSAAENFVGQAVEALRRGVSTTESSDAPRAFAVQEEAAGAGDERRDLAARILANNRISLATTHVSGVSDDANARENMRDTSEGRPASRSSYGNAPGGTVLLNLRLLRGIQTLLDEYTLSVSELAGGSHSPNSRHYAEVAVDLTVINGRHVSANHPDVPRIKARCRELGATEVLGPGDAGHSDHVHAAWPRP